MLKALFIPGNGGGRPTDNWFPFLKRELSRLGIKVIAEEFPDNQLARAEYWLSHIKKLGADEETILIGHSSGAIASMRYAEQYRILGSILVGAYHTDLGIDAERQSGYFDNPWNFQAIKQNQKWIALFAGKDDPWIPVEEARFLNDQLDSYYFEFPAAGHFGGDYYKEYFPEIVTFIKERMPTAVAKTIIKKIDQHLLIESNLCGDIRIILSGEDRCDVDLAILENIKPTVKHFHKYFKEIYLLLDGESELELVEDGIISHITVKANEAVVIPPLVGHRITRASSNARLCVISLPAFDSDDEHVNDIK